MLRNIRKRIEDERGFTLIELLVVILIIGILAAIALPAFLGQRVKGQDSDAKSNARNVVSELESCFVEKDTYVGCEAQAISEAGVERTTVTGTTAKAYTVTATSKSNNTFTITKNEQGISSRSCTVPTTGSDKGGCKSGSW